MSNPTDPIRFSVPSSGISDRSRKLGRGLGALLGESRREEPLVRAGQQDLPESEKDGYTGSYRSEEHTSEIQSLMRISYAVFCLKKHNNTLAYKSTINII